MSRTCPLEGLSEQEMRSRVSRVIGCVNDVCSADDDDYFSHIHTSSVCHERTSEKEKKKNSTPKGVGYGLGFARASTSAASPASGLLNPDR